MAIPQQAETFEQDKRHIHSRLLQVLDFALIVESVNAGLAG